MPDPSIDPSKRESDLPPEELSFIARDGADPDTRLQTPPEAQAETVAPEPPPQVESPAPDPPKPGRILSIDVLRGLTILLMIFVNDLGTVSGAPWWMKHFRADGDGMTFVDVIFPAFLFIVGMAIPFSIGRRLDRGESLAHVWLHVLVRTLGLLLIGVYMVNSYSVSDAGRLTALQWVVAMYACVILVWNTGPRDPGALKVVFHTLQAAGVLGLLALAVFYHGSTDPATIAARPDLWWVAIPASAFVFGLALLLAVKGKGVPGLVPVVGLACGLFLVDAIGWAAGQWGLSLAWQVDLRTQWWGILGLIGWAYLVAAVVHTLTRNNAAFHIGWAAVLLIVYIADSVPVSGDRGFFPDLWFNRYVGIGSMLGAHAAITVLGLALGAVLRPDSGLRTHAQRVRWALGFALGLAAVGAMLYPLANIEALHGAFRINKNAATVTWCLFSVACTVGVWVLIYAICDIAGVRFWTWLVKPAGENPLFAYILHPMVIAIIMLVAIQTGNTWYADLGAQYPGGLYRAIGMAFGVTFAAGLLRYIGIRLRL